MRHCRRQEGQELTYECVGTRWSPRCSKTEGRFFFQERCESLQFLMMGESVLATQTGSVPNSARLTYLSVYDRRDVASEPVHSPSHPPRSRMHTGASVLATQTGAVCLTPRDWRILVCMTTEMSLLCLHTPRPHPPRSRMHTAYHPTLSPHPCSSLSCALRSFGVLRVWPGLVPPAWPWDPILGLLFFLPEEPSVYEACRILSFSF